jgi:small-conductance mechanosensitive channel
VPDPENPPGPTVVPGAYAVDLEVAGKVRSARFTVVKDPRLPATPADYAAQFALHKELVAALSKLKQALNRLRRTKRQLDEVADRAGKGERALRNRAKAIGVKLAAIERVMVDPQRKSVRDVLRNPAGLNDTLFDMIAMTTTADAAPTSQTKAVSREVMDKVDSEVAKFEALARGDIAQLNAALAKARVRYVAAA